MIIIVSQTLEILTMETTQMEQHNIGAELSIDPTMVDGDIVGISLLYGDLEVPVDANNGSFELSH